MSLQKILKLMEKKYPAGDENGWLGAMLILYDDGGGYINRTRLPNENPDDFSGNYMRNHLFSFITIKELVEHLQS
jgi:hypothetical protein